MTDRTTSEDGSLVTFDDGAAVYLTAEEMSAYGLYEGETMHAPADALLGHVLCQRMLAAVGPYVLYCKRTERMVRQRVMQWSGWAEDAWIPYREAALDELIDHLKENGYLDDMAYSRSYVRSKAGTPVSEQALLAALAQRGVDGETAEAAVREADLDEMANARAVLLRKMQGVSSAGRGPAQAGRGSAQAERGLTQAERMKLCRFLCGRGFSPETARKTVAEWEKEQDEAE